MAIVHVSNPEFTYDLSKLADTTSTVLKSPKGHLYNMGGLPDFILQSNGLNFGQWYNHAILSLYDDLGVDYTHTLQDMSTVVSRIEPLIHELSFETAVDVVGTYGQTVKFHLVDSEVNDHIKEPQRFNYYQDVCVVLADFIATLRGKAYKQVKVPIHHLPQMVQMNIDPYEFANLKVEYELRHLFRREVLF